MLSQLVDAGIFALYLLPEGSLDHLRRADGGAGAVTGA
jgi:hypothetical protein